MPVLAADFWRDVGAPLLARVEHDYRWAIPSNPPVAFQSKGDAFRDNLALRSALHDVWRAAPARRTEISEWFVRDWGGIRRNHPRTIAGHVEAAENGGPARLRAVSSWSKIVVLADPNRYAIYDARVAFALNALQILEHGHVVEQFPVPLGRNNEINRAIGVLKLPGVRYATDRSAYERYLEVLNYLGPTLQRAEMALFATSEQLAQRIE